jgi:hypothetical protein
MKFILKTYHSMFGNYHQGSMNGSTCGICNTQLFFDTALFVWIEGKIKFYPINQWVCSEKCANMLIFQTME